MEEDHLSQANSAGTSEKNKPSHRLGEMLILTIILTSSFFIVEQITRNVLNYDSGFIKSTQTLKNWTVINITSAERKPVRFEYEIGTFF